MTPYAIKSSLQRRLDYLLTQHGSVLSEDDLADVDDADDTVIAGLESFFEPVDVATCNTNRLNLQSRHLQTRIKCNYNCASARIKCN